MIKKILFVSLFTLAFVSCSEDEEKKKEVVADLGQQEVIALAIDKDNAKWVATDKGLYRSVEKGYTLEDISISGKITSLAYDKNSNLIWVGTGNGLAQISIKADDSEASAINNTNLSNSKVSSIYVDPSFTKWVGTESGLSMLKNAKWKKTGFAEESDEFNIDELHISSIANNGDDYYFATIGKRVVHAYGYDGSLDAFSGASLLKEPYNGNAISDTMFVVFVDSKKRQWMGGPYGIQWHPDVNIKLDGNYYDQLPNNRVHAIAEAPNGNIWVGTEKGIAIFNNTDWSVSTANLPDTFVTAIAFDNSGTAWVGTKKGLTSIK